MKKQRTPAFSADFLTRLITTTVEQQAQTNQTSTKELNTVKLID